MLKGLFIAAGLAGLTASAASAADVIVEEPVLYNWSGAYIGGQVGYAWGDGKGEFTNGDYFDADADGFIGGIYLGYNQQLANNVVVGIDADFVGSDASDDDAPNFDADGNSFPDDNRGSLDLEWSGAVRGRVGYAFDRVLPYLAAGVAFGKVDYSDRADAFGVYTEGDDTYVGYTVGAGVEYAFTDKIIGRAEYRFSDFGDEDFDATSLALPINVDLKTHDIRLGLAYKF